MIKLRYAMKSINVINCLLLLTVAAAAYDIVIPFLNLKIRMTLPAIGKSTPGPAETQASVIYPSPAEFELVGEQNLFHPERRIPPEKKVEIAAPAMPKPDLVLYGTLISDTISIAYIEDRKTPYSTPGRGKRQTQLKKGDGVSGYILQEIGQDRIVLAKGGEKLVVLLQDKGKNRSSETTAAVAGTKGPAVALPARAGVPAASRTAASSGDGGAFGFFPAPGEAAASPPMVTLPASAGRPASLPEGTASPATAEVPSPAQNTATPPAVAPQGGQLNTGTYRRGARPYDIRPIPRQ